MDPDEIFKRYQQEVKEMQQKFTSEIQQMHSEWEDDAQEAEDELNRAFASATVSTTTFEQVRGPSKAFFASNAFHSVSMHAILPTHMLW